MKPCWQLKVANFINRNDDNVGFFSRLIMAELILNVEFFCKDGKT